MMDTVLIWAGTFALFCFALAFTCATIRLLLGPTPQDRVLAVDTMYINGICIVLVLGVNFATSVYFDIALLMALFGFISSSVMAKFLFKGEVIQP
jgi:multicomponent K+:H+ antiporter subunit F|tara:strand:- start:21143 stop:21427 length:285 start_codon:yes stop_codon:yes gene_type:complete